MHLDTQRRQTQIKAYLTKLSDIKHWCESMQPIKTGTTAEFEAQLRKGVILAHITKHFAPECVETIYEKEELHYRHTDNINYFFKGLEAIHFPRICVFETTDLYDAKNMPKVVYCLHALAYYLKKYKGESRAMSDSADCIGKRVYEFSAEQINEKEGELDRLGIKIPVFDNIEKDVDRGVAVAERLRNFVVMSKKNVEVCFICGGDYKDMSDDEYMKKDMGERARGDINGGDNTMKVDNGVIKKDDEYTKTDTKENESLISNNQTVEYINTSVNNTIDSTIHLSSNLVVCSGCRGSIVPTAIRSMLYKKAFLDIVTKSRVSINSLRHFLPFFFSRSHDLIMDRTIDELVKKSELMQEEAVGLEEEADEYRFKIEVMNNNVTNASNIYAPTLHVMAYAPRRRDWDNVLNAIRCDRTIQKTLAPSLLDGLLTKNEILVVFHKSIPVEEINDELMNNVAFDTAEAKRFYGGVVDLVDESTAYDLYLRNCKRQRMAELLSQSDFLEAVAATQPRNKVTYLTTKQLNSIYDRLPVALKSTVTRFDCDEVLMSFNLRKSLSDNEQSNFINGIKQRIVFLIGLSSKNSLKEILYRTTEEESAVYEQKIAELKSNYCEEGSIMVDDSYLNNSIYNCLTTNNIITIAQFKDSLIDDIARIAEGRSVTETANSLLSLLAQDIVSIKLMDEERGRELSMAEEAINAMIKKLALIKRKRDYLAEYYKKYLSVVCIKKNLVFKGSVNSDSKYGKYAYSSSRLRKLGVVDSKYRYEFSCNEPIVITVDAFDSDTKIVSSNIHLEELLRMRVGGIKKVKLCEHMFDVDGLVRIVNELYID